MNFFKHKNNITISLSFIILLLLLLSSCKSLSESQYNVDTTSCNGCGECLQVCPSDAIDFDTDGKAIIDQTKCTQCAKCLNICPNEAIY